MFHATVAQLVEQLTRNEQVVRSNRISSSIPARAIALCGFCFSFRSAAGVPVCRATGPRAGEKTGVLRPGDLSRA